MMDLEELRARLSMEYDVTDWWPSESPFEVMVGAVLTQQTVWETVSKVLGAMRAKSLLDVARLAGSDGQLEEIIRPTGFYRQKAMRLRSMAQYLLDEHNGDVRAFLDRDTAVLRKELMSMKGVGSETADSIILFGAGKPSFVAASYVSRALSRTGAYQGTSYDEVKDFVEARLPYSVHAHREFYALCVHHCKTVCLTRPKCDICPLSADCPSRIR